MAAIVSECEKSGVSAYAFCQARGLNLAAFYRWRRMLQSPPPAFIEMRLTADEKDVRAAGPLLGVKLSNGSEFQIYDQSIIACVIAQVAKLGSSE